MQLLRPEVAHYDWGGREAIPRLLGVSPDGRPWAELWFGTHPSRPTRLADGRPLESVTGPLPYLLKVLAIAEPLSIQAHPDVAQARAGYAAEQAAGLPLDHPMRSYRDDRAKPELLLATEPTDLLCGFREPDDAAELFAALAVPGLASVIAALDEADPMRRALAAALTVPEAAVVAEVGAAATRLAATGGRLGRDAQWLARLAARHPQDRGVVAACLLRLLHLRSGEALSLAAGNVHAYLRGGGVEVMGASDTVLRGGLTSKHVDVAGLLDIADCRPAPPTVLRPVPESPGVTLLDVGAAEFVLRVIEPGGGQVTLPGHGPRVLLVLDGPIDVAGDPVATGTALLAEPAEHPVLSGSGRAVLVGSGG